MDARRHDRETSSGRKERSGNRMESKKHILLIVRIDVEPEMEEEFNRWYNEEHIPTLLKVPGVLWGKRAINTGPGPKYIAVYEHENIEVQRSEAYQKAAQTEWTRRIEHPERCSRAQATYLAPLPAGRTRPPTPHIPSFESFLARACTAHTTRPDFQALSKICSGSRLYVANSS